jgi:hypothetical protein
MRAPRNARLCATTVALPQPPRPRPEAGGCSSASCAGGGRAGFEVVTQGVVLQCIGVEGSSGSRKSAERLLGIWTQMARESRPRPLRRLPRLISARLSMRPGLLC